MRVHRIIQNEAVIKMSVRDVIIISLIGLMAIFLSINHPLFAQMEAKEIMDGGMINLIGTHTPERGTVSESTVLDGEGTIIGIDGGGKGFSIVRIEEEKEINMLTVTSPKKAKGEMLPAGIYKVYPSIGEKNSCKTCPDFREAWVSVCVRMNKEQ